MTICCDDYLPDTTSALLLKCHRCFCMVEVEDPTPGLIYICDMCHADLEITDVDRGYTRPPPPATAVIGNHATTGLFCPTKPGTTAPVMAPTGSTVISGRFASSATLFRKGPHPSPESGTGLFRFTPSSGHPIIDPPADDPRRQKDEMELEPTTAVFPERLLPRMLRRFLKLIIRPWAPSTS